MWPIENIDIYMYIYNVYVLYCNIAIAINSNMYILQFKAICCNYAEGE